MILDDVCSNISFVLRIVAVVLKVGRWIIPILLIALVCFDLFKVVTGNVDEKAKREATSTAVKRVIYAIIIFLIPSIVTFVLVTINGYLPHDARGDAVTWIDCWNSIYNNAEINIKDYVSSN